MGNENSPRPTTPSGVLAQKDLRDRWPAWYIVEVEDLFVRRHLNIGVVLNVLVQPSRSGLHRSNAEEVRQHNIVAPSNWVWQSYDPSSSFSSPHWRIGVNHGTLFVWTNDYCSDEQPE
jgi:hypothetical protein